MQYDSVLFYLFFVIWIQVYERGVKAIPLCSDLWIHYITFQMQNLLKDENREAKIRE